MYNIFLSFKGMDFYIQQKLYLDFTSHEFFTYLP
jgi:hypothetical protein